MNAADRNVYGFVFVYRADLAVHRDLGGALYDHPMLGPMEMLLQRQLSAGLHHDAFDLVTRARIDSLIVAPGSVDPPVLDRLAPIFGLEMLDQFLYVLCLVTRGDEHGVAGRDNDHVVEPDDGREHSVVGAHE